MSQCEPFLLSFSGIHKCYESRVILESANLKLARGECHLLLGENGAGKSTLLRIMAGLLRPDAGRVCSESGNLHWKQVRKQLREKVMYLHQTPYLFDGSVLQNLRYAANSINKHQRKSCIEGVLAWSGLTDLAKSPAQQLSGGEKQRLALARAKLRQTPILLLDEPSANLDQESREKTIGLLGSLKEEGICLLIACHDPQVYSRVSDGEYHLSKGALRLKEA